MNEEEEEGKKGRREEGVMVRALAKLLRVLR